MKYYLFISSIYAPYWQHFASFLTVLWQRGQDRNIKRYGFIFTFFWENSSGDVYRKRHGLSDILLGSWSWQKITAPLLHLLLTWPRKLLTADSQWVLPKASFYRWLTATFSENQLYNTLGGLITPLRADSLACQTQVKLITLKAGSIPVRCAGASTTAHWLAGIL